MRRLDPALTPTGTSLMGEDEGGATHTSATSSQLNLTSSDPWVFSTGYRVLDCSIAMAGPVRGPAPRRSRRRRDQGRAGDRRVAAPPRRGGRRARQPHQRLVPVAQPQQALAGGRPQSDPDGKAVLLELVKTADVFLQNYRPGVAKRLGVDYETLSRRSTRGWSTSRSRGYGEDRSLRRPPRPGLAAAGHVRRGAVGRPRRARPPHAAGQYLVDAITASTAFEGVMAALLHRERTGEGQLVQVNMLDAIVTIQMQELSVFTGRPEAAGAHGRAPCPCPSSARPTAMFATSDGFIIVCLSWSQPNWAS